MTHRRTFDPQAAKATPPVSARPDRACNDDDVGDLFYPTHASGFPAAVAVCHRCPHEGDCLDWALETRQSFGVWGGRTPDERHEMLRQRKASPGGVD